MAFLFIVQWLLTAFFYFSLPGDLSKEIKADCDKKQKTRSADRVLLYLVPGSSLLSHGETPHYHRRYGVSLLSSAWGQVGPPRYGRQANSFLSAEL